MLRTWLSLLIIKFNLWRVKCIIFGVLHGFETEDQLEAMAYTHLKKLVLNQLEALKNKQS